MRVNMQGLVHNSAAHVGWTIERSTGSLPKLVAPEVEHYCMAVNPTPMLTKDRKYDRQSEAVQATVGAQSNLS